MRPEGTEEPDAQKDNAEPGVAGGSASEVSHEPEGGRVGVAEHAPPLGRHTDTGAPDAVPDDLADAEAEPDEEPPKPGALSGERLRSVLESLLLASERPLTLDRAADLLGCTNRSLYAELSRLAQDCIDQGRGIQLHEVAGGYQLRTAPQNAEYVQRLLQARPVRLTRAQLETLAIIAYRQPITRPEIDDVRGVDSGGTLKMLLEGRLLRILGKREEPGRPILYGTTREFLEFFNLRDLKDLPTLREFYELSEEHQAQVNSMGGGLDDDLSPKKAAEPTPPPPLTRIELKDLDLGDDEAELTKIDEMIGKVRTDFSLEAVMAEAGMPLKTADPEAEAPTPVEDEREPEEL